MKKETFFSQYGQDKFLVNFFKEKRNGIFIDIGAFDGVTFSNTFYLEKELGWDGICVEPNPLPFRELQKNRKCTLVNCGVGKTNTSLKFLAISGGGKMLSGFVDSFDKRHLDRVEKHIMLSKDKKEFLDIKVRTLNDILNEYHTCKIDYCNIDVEGGEMNVLESIDFDKVRIKVFSIENNYGESDVQNFLKKKGYSKINKIGADEFFEYKSRSFCLMLHWRIKNVKRLLSKIKSNIINRN